MMQSVNALMKRRHLVDEFKTEVSGQNGGFLDGMNSQMSVTKASPQVRGHYKCLT